VSINWETVYKLSRIIDPAVAQNCRCVCIHCTNPPRIHCGCGSMFCDDCYIGCHISKRDPVCELRDVVESQEGTNNELRLRKNVC
jgi:hypothetical protein